MLLLSLPVPKQAYTRTSYNYWVNRDRGYRYYIRASQLNASKILIVDNLQEWYAVPHRKSGSLTAAPIGVSALYADGHAAFCIDKDIFGADAISVVSNPPQYNGVFLWGQAATCATDTNYNNVPGNYTPSFEALLTLISARQ